MGVELAADRAHTACVICPRRCGADRFVKPGLCGVGERPRVARAALHHWEEPCISGMRGSGTVFFSGCPLKCCYCQNHEISTGASGKDISIERLAEIYLELQTQGAHNVNLVSPTHFARQIAAALRLAKDGGLKIPIIWNSGGYDSLEGLSLVDGLVDIYMPDIKYMDAERSRRYSKAADYFSVASLAVIEMFRQAGPAVFDCEGILQSGLLIRHLVLPGGTLDSVTILDWIADHFDKESVVISLMSQYTPCHESAGYPEINRRLTSLEYNRVLEHFHMLGFQYAYCQQRESAEASYVPAFDFDGV
jgi:putative pyruvate formate lyase activating enzyme